MKLNLPSTWNQQKMSSLLLLSFSNLIRVQGGDEFRNCIGSGNYSRIIDYANNVPYINNYVNFCCPIPNGKCINYASDAPYYPCTSNKSITIGCNKEFNGTNFCLSSSWEVNKKSQVIIGNPCGGFISNNTVFTNSSGVCPTNISLITNSLQGKSGGNIPLCCNPNGNCKDGKLDSPGPGAPMQLNCLGNSQFALLCYHDNDNWGCTGDAATFSNQASFGTCMIEIGNKLENFTNLTTVSNIFTASKTIESSLTTFSNSSNLSSSNLTLEQIIGIILGAVSGVSAFSYLAIIIRKRRKKALQKQEESIELTNFEARNEHNTPSNKPHETTTYYQQLNEITFQNPHEQENFQKPDEQYETYIEVDALRVREV